MHFCITIKYDNSKRLQYSNSEAAKDLLTHQNANKRTTYGLSLKGPLK